MSGHDSRSATAGLSKTLQEKEEEYQRMNAKLAAQTAKLVEEADMVMRQQDNFLNQVSPPRSSHSRSPVSPPLVSNHNDDQVNVSSRDTGLLSIAAGAFEDQSSEDEEYLRQSVRPSSHLSSGQNRNLTQTSVKKQVPDSKVKKVAAKRRPKSGAKPPKSAADDVAIVDDFSFAKSVSNIERKVNERESTSSAMLKDDVMPEAAAEMGSEAQIRYLKAKLRVLQEDFDTSSQECQKVIDEKSKVDSQLKEAKEECERLKKNQNLQQSAMQKLKSAFEEEKKNSEAKFLQFQAANKEVNSLKREQKQSTTAQSAVEVRLNRALEEIDKLKSQLQKQKFSGKEASDRDTREIEHLRNENKRHERMRNDTMAIIKKQQKLIGILKRQVLHIEAAKLLSFTEEEFVKALDWNDK